MTEPSKEAVERWPDGFTPSSPLSQSEIDEAAQAAICDCLNEVYMTVKDSAAVWAEATLQLQARLRIERERWEQEVREAVGKRAEQLAAIGLPRDAAVTREVLDSIFEKGEQ